MSNVKCSVGRLVHNGVRCGVCSVECRVCRLKCGVQCGERRLWTIALAVMCGVWIWERQMC